jgi:cytidyltransferase-like protein
MLKEMKAYSLFIGRWQPWHEGHRWLIDQRLKEGKNVWVAIRDVEPNEKQPWTPQEVLSNLSEELKDLLQEGRIKITIVPDIESINYGRGVGYEVIEHIPPTNIEEISATKIREQMRKDGKLD